MLTMYPSGVAMEVKVSVVNNKWIQLSLRGSIRKLGLVHDKENRTNLLYVRVTLYGRNL